MDTTRDLDTTTEEPTGPIQTKPTTIEPAITNGTAAAVAGPEILQAEPTPGPGGRRTRLIGGVIVGLAAAAAAAWFIANDGDEQDESIANPTPIEAITAEVRDLIEYTELDGTLTYGDSFSVGPRRDGTITSLAATGDTVERGDVLWEIDEQPTVLFYGSTPVYRQLASGVEGEDVAVVEENLAALGFTADGTMVVDDVFDAGTAEAIEEMQRELGLNETGELAVADVHVEAGPVIIDDTFGRPGNAVRADTMLLEVSLVESTSVLLAPTAGLITDVAPPGTALDTGTTLYEVDTIPIPILIGEPISRTLDVGVDDGEDIETLERLLADLGFDADGELEVDEVWDGASAEALGAWEEELGVEVDGIFQVDQFASLTAPGTIAETSVERGDDVVRGTAIATLVEPTKVVTTQVTIDDRDLLPLGETVDVDLGGGEIVSGTVSWVSSSSTIPAGQPDADPVFDVEITLDRIPESFAGFDELDVEVLLVDSIAEGAVTVPASALISTGSSFAVEVVDGTTTRFVEVDAGMFADGWVEVTGIDAGTAVVVPS